MNRGMPPPRSKRRKAVTAKKNAFAEDAGGLIVDGIEVVQVVQDMSHSVALIAGKPTVVRVYLSRPARGAVTVRGEISVRRTPTGASQNVPSLDTARVSPTQNDQLGLKREDLRLSLNFRLPTSLTAAGNRVFISVNALTDAATGARVDCLNCDDARVAVRFVEAAPLRVRLIKLRYRTPAQPDGYLPTARDASLLKSWLRRAYPVSRVVFSEASVETNIHPPFSDSIYNRVNAQLTAIRNLDVDGGRDQRTHYYGMVSDEGDFMRGGANSIPDAPDPTAVASGPTGSSGYPWDTDGSYGDWYGAHELAHTLGRYHPGFCNKNSGDDPDYPFDNGQLSDADGAFVGFDIGDPALGVPMRALPGHRWHDVMTYCARQWMSSYTYEGIRLRLAAEDALGATPAPDERGFAEKHMATEAANALEVNMATEAANALEVNMATGDFINVVATVNLTAGTGEILYVNPVSRALRTAAGGESNVELRVLSADGRPLAAYPAPVKLNSCADAAQDRAGIVDALIPAHAEARQLELLIAGQVVATFRAGGTVPELSNLRRKAFTESAMSLAWDAAAETEGANLTYNVQASTDDGQTWQTVAVGRTSPDAEIDRTQFPPGSRVTVRVIATDGFTNRIADSETFSVDEPEQ